jgi:hypothetical protein
MYKQFVLNKTKTLALYHDLEGTKQSKTKT